ncbi:mitochondrial import receptor protein [Puccinia graminis f. sp. tritici]|uniref:Mitochondrial import receptor protein n=2 Tax=Puccinia graminis f. sp. tritici TaxID=56615 RepID=E3KQD4_PUCGT|nr:uncharacterized protein PGTG_12465 [Puccinia graminis f. sp. tritici CRL 75-36-700-3]KAA1096687.1 mitochondrial import receptor protein [Puccinia graminis f. sp. tritici]EFP86509.1 hypothetical protein PGTG_12465 [Puccinia graminis f. sp. tritici CRL 75-36-700-3]KAA1113280.1 mitochondrial import receptor protein [Puccinia graminis f. sp. tritici]KAA1131731.1 mitochondrial import receptor protein [Puccinia graminis f. sp. tritici]KAA1132498.1 mitochondrial import receptor protein [Puccinia g
MVKIEELKLDDGDDGFVTESDGSSTSDPSEADQADDRSSADSDDEELQRSLEMYRVEDETIVDRIYALRDIIRPTTRESICERWNSIWEKSSSTGRTLGNLAWVLTTSIILVGLPMALSIEAESMLVSHEKEMERQRQGQHTLTTSGTTPNGDANQPPAAFS